jgi:hypothetical protein
MQRERRASGCSEDGLEQRDQLVEFERRRWFFIEAARVRAGDMYADPLILGDFGLCKGLLAKL